jgi:hypothetical protein
MKATCSSKTLVDFQNIHNHLCESLKSYGGEENVKGKLTSDYAVRKVLQQHKIQVGAFKSLIEFRW